MSKYYTIKITGGTSPGPYTIYLNTNPGPIPFISGTTILAENLTYGQLFSPPNGVTVVVPDETEIIYLYNQLCTEELISVCVSSFMCFTYRGISSSGTFTFSCSVREGVVPPLFNGKKWWDLTNCPVDPTGFNGNPCPFDTGFVWWDFTGSKWIFSTDLGYGTVWSTLYNPSSNEYPIPFGPNVWEQEQMGTCPPEMINSTFGPCSSQNPQPLIPPVRIIYKDFCISYYPSGNPNAKKSYHFIPSDVLDSNGNPTWYWESNINSKVVWNSTESEWNIINFIIEGGEFYDSVSLINSNPPLNWSSRGTLFPLTLESVSGSCTTSNRSTFPVSINQPTCFCDGSIVFNVSLDNPPYSYSIDNGVTYSSSPIFTNLCSGIYLLSVSDYLGNVFSKTITIDKPEMSTTYTLSLNTTTTTPIINEISLVNSYETTITVTPPLPDGTTITFDLIHDNSFYSSPTSGTSILTTGTILNSNFTTIPVSFTSTGNTKSVNTRPGCQSDFIYQSDTNEVWNSITLTNTDTIVISTTTRVDKTTTGLCVVGYSNDTYSISNAIISGCDCCSLIVNA
jgi:hypothetical protein